MISVIPKKFDGESYSFAEMQLVHSKAPAHVAIIGWENVGITLNFSPCKMEMKSETKNIIYFKQLLSELIFSIKSNWASTNILASSFTPFPVYLFI